MKLLSLFSGIGAFEKALNNLGVNYELVGFSEIDKWAMQSYCAIHNINNTLNLGDVRNITADNLPNGIDIITHGSPCQDFSVAGKREGGDKGSGTRSSLMWETVRIVSEILPKVVVWENVRSVLFKNNIDNFNLYLSSLEKIGYKNYYKVLKASDFGVPQSRNRIFVVSFRDDVDLYNNFEFPNGRVDSHLSMDGVLQHLSEIDSKYFYGDDREYIYTNPPLKEPTNKLNHVAYFKYPNSNKRHQSNTFYDTNGLCPTIDTAGGGNREPKVLDNGYFRKLTPYECWILMGFDSEDFYKASGIGMSDTQLYKQAGNSIVVPILEELFLKIIEYLNGQ